MQPYLQFLGDRRGNIALMTAVLAPVMLLTAGAGVDFSRWSHQRANLKEVADLLATRGAREFLLAHATESNIKSVLDAAVANDVGDTYNLGSFAHLVNVDMTNTTVSVSLSQAPKPGLILTKFSPFKKDMEIRSTAVARGGSNVCVIALEENKEGALAAAGAARLAAPECAVMSNSKSPNGVSVTGAATISADVICSAGGYSGGLLHYDVAPTTDCPAYADPLAGRTPPPVGACDYDGLEIGDPLEPFDAGDEAAATATVKTLAGDLPGTLPGKIRYDLTPGVYCGGIEIVEGNADVHLSPGIYVIKDGELLVERGARIYGEHVGFYLDGPKATFAFEQSSIIHLTAPRDGPMAGILIWEGDSVDLGRIHAIESANARELLGTIYLKKGTLSVNSDLPIADASAYTAIVVNKLDMAGSPTLQLNADYGLTDVPVPAGVGPVGGATYLRE